MIPIHGMKRRTHLDENVATVDIELTPEELARLDEAFPARCGGGRPVHNGGCTPGGPVVEGWAAS